MSRYFTEEHEWIDVEGDTATGRWYLQDTVLITEHRMQLRGAAFYDDAYTRGPDGAWRISRTGYVRSYESVETLGETWRLTANRWAAAVAGEDA